MKAELRAAVEDLLVASMDSVMDKVLRLDPFDMDQRRRNAPLHAALVPEDIFKGSHFERRFVTPFGRVWERLAALIGENAFGFGANQHMIIGEVRQGCLDRIQRTLDALEHGSAGGDRTRPNWEEELRHVKAGTGRRREVRVNCDVFVSRSPKAPGLAFELKAAQPNSDQTKVSKEKLFKLLCMEPRQVQDAYFALPYNPYGSRQSYSWSFPSRWFNMREDPCVLIGDDLWEKLGGDGTYEAILELAAMVGRRYRQRIYDEYLGIPMPQ